MSSPKLGNEKTAQLENVNRFMAFIAFAGLLITDSGNKEKVIGRAGVGY
jgi:hypothetical protein